MSNLNIIQRRELEPVMLKASRLIKHYQIAANCVASLIGPDLTLDTNSFNSICKHCDRKVSSKCGKNCVYLHLEAVAKARQLGGSYIYVCSADLVFWTSPFYSGERFAGALLSGGVQGTEKNSVWVKSLAQLMLICADQISSMSFIQKNIPSIKPYHQWKTTNTTVVKKQNTENIYPLDLERMLLASLRRGDKVEGQKVLVKLLNTLHQETTNNFPVFRLKAIELAVLLSRAVSDPKAIEDNTALDTTNRYLNKIEESTNLQEITNILSSITERMSGMIFSFHGVRHFTALRKAERYIWQNYTRKISLREIANASGLSAPYFSTIFKEEMGENLSNYLNKLRVEKAAAMLVTTDLSISDIAKRCGFEDQSWFSKIFRNNTGLTPGKYRERGMVSEGTILS